MDILDPFLVQTDVGTKICMVLEWQGCVDDHLYAGTGVSSGQKLLFQEQLPLEQGHRGTLYFWQVEEIRDDGSALLGRHSGSKVHPCSARSDDHALPTLISMCAGMGGIIMGARKAGFETAVAIDRSPKAKELLQANFSFPVLQGNLGDLEVIEKAHSIVGERMCFIEGGYPCQPYSTLGDQRGFSDARAHTLIDLLRGAWLLQVRGLVLECVTGAAKDPQVRKHVEVFARAMKCQQVDQVLHLDRFWPTRRTRWWNVVFPDHWKSFKLEDLPESQFRTIEDIIPSWPVWPLEEETALRWTEQEEACFRNPQFGPTDRTIKTKGKFPTILHSCGCHFRGCPCECRRFAFTEDRLLHGGLHCPEIRSMHSPTFSRYPHPEELGFLHGVDLDYKYGNVKDSLCMLGQIAAPWQSLWCFLQLREVLPVQVDGQVQCDYLLRQEEGDDRREYDIVKNIFINEAYDYLLAQQCKWATALNAGPFSVKVNLPQEPAYSVKLAKRTQVGELLAAHSKVARTNDGQATYHTVELGVDDFVPKEIFVRDQPLLADTAVIQVIFKHGDCSTAITGPPGSYLFDLATQAGFDQDRWCFVQIISGEEIPRGKDFIIASNSIFRMRPLISGGGLRPHQILGEVLADPNLHRWHQECRKDGHVAPGYDKGLEDVTVTYAAVALVRIAKLSEGVCLIPPTVVQQWLQSDHDEANDVVAGHLGHAAGARIIAILGSDGHWALLDYNVFDEGGSEATYVDGLEDRLWDTARQVGSLIHECVSSESLSHVKASCFSQARDNSCGAVMLLHLGWRLGLWNAFSPHDVREWYQLLRWGMPKPTLFGGGREEQPDEALESILGNYLTSKGVPEAAVRERIADACRTLGRQKITDALQSKNPWQSLKALGNSRPRPFLWVRYDELRAFIDKKGREKWGAATDVPRRKEFRKKQDHRKVEDLLNPASLVLPTGVFTDGTNDIPQIEFAAVKSGAVGVAFCRCEDAQPHLNVRRSISLGPLLLLILGHDEAVAELKGITVPATYKGTGEPVLVHCSLLQIGDVTVCEKAVKAPEVGTLPTRVLRLQVYRDEWEHSWEELAQKPIRSLTNVVEALQLCREAGCNQRCGRYHAAVEENGVESAIVDLWGWRWAGQDGKKAPQTEAVSFSLFIRVPESGFDLLNEGCEVSGVYFEPRLPQGQGTDPAFAVVWIAQANGRHVRHLAKTEDKVVGIARLGDRFGIRVKAVHAEELHKKHCPNKPFMQGSVKQIYRVEPLPPGTHRQGLADALGSFGWDIKPLQAARGSQGRAWEIGASGPPPQATLKLASGYVTITKVRDNQPRRSEEAIVASNKTKEHIRAEPASASSSASPWGQDGDPWAIFLKSKQPTATETPGPLPVAAEVKTKLEEVRASVLQEVNDQLQGNIEKFVSARDADMPQATQADERLDRLEHEIHALQQQGEKFEQWFAVAGEQNSAQSAQLGRVEAQLEQQSQFATRLAHTVESCTTSLTHHQDIVQNLAQEVQGVKGHMESTLDRFFARQTAQIESMLAKENKENTEQRKKARQDDI